MDYVLSVLTLLAIYAVLASSLNIVLGHGGLLSLCHAAFYAIGAYTAALTALHLGWSYLPPQSLSQRSSRVCWPFLFSNFGGTTSFSAR
jgi:ABC-type branched-subunit amino acid transport system permease subunit